jgi:hypothetical protein
MRLGLWFGGMGKRNENYILEDPRPIPRQKDTVCSGDAGLDGFSVLARASTDRPGPSPSVQGTEGWSHRSPSEGWEQ